MVVSYLPDYSSVTFRRVFIASIDDIGFKEPTWKKKKKKPTATKAASPIYEEEDRVSSTNVAHTIVLEENSYLR